jgi:hypothetical protein
LIEDLLMKQESVKIIEMKGKARARLIKNVESQITEVKILKQAKQLTLTFDRDLKMTLPQRRR